MMEANRAGASAYITKPFQTERLLDTVRQVLRRRLRVQRRGDRPADARRGPGRAAAPPARSPVPGSSVRDGRRHAQPRAHPRVRGRGRGLPRSSPTAWQSSPATCCAPTTTSPAPASATPSSWSSLRRGTTTCSRDEDAASGQGTPSARPERSPRAQTGRWSLRIRRCPTWAGRGSHCRPGEFRRALLEAIDQASLSVAQERSQVRHRLGRSWTDCSSARQISCVYQPIVSLRDYSRAGLRAARPGPGAQRAARRRGPVRGGARREPPRRARPPLSLGRRARQRHAAGRLPALHQRRAEHAVLAGGRSALGHRASSRLTPPDLRSSPSWRSPRRASSTTSTHMRDVVKRAPRAAGSASRSTTPAPGTPDCRPWSRSSPTSSSWT